MTDMTNMPGGQGQCTVQDVMAVMEEAYPPDFAEQWDHPGLVCGDPTAVVKHVCCAVDLTPATLDAALAEHAQMVITHHPVLFDSVHSVAANTPKGKLIHRAISAGCALFCAHTNADSANPGVNDALAEALGLTVTGPLIPHSPGNNGDKHAPGLGRIGTLTKPLTLREFTNVVAASLPRTVWGIRAAGDPQTRIETVAVLGKERPSDEFLSSVAGPPMQVTMARLGWSPAEIEEGKRFCFNHYDTCMWDKPELFTGIKTALNKLSAMGYELYLATSKREKVASKTLQHVGIHSYFTEIVGAHDDGRTRQTKDEVIAEALRRAGDEPAAPQRRYVMVGDRIHDVEGAKVFGIKTILCTWGTGSPAEWDHAASTVNDPADLPAAIRALLPVSS